MNTSRYNRQIILPEVGIQGQEKLGQAKVLLVGVGGLGAAVLPYLVAAGIGEIGLIDDDVVDESNLQRQVIYKNNSIGKSKVAEAKIMVLDLNPTVIINTFDEKLNPKNAILLFENYDIVVDATDNLNTKHLINDTSIVTKTPFVYGSVYKFEGQVSVFNYQNGPSYRCLFPEKEDGIAIPSCEMSGVLGMVPQTLGSFQATEVLKIILGIGEVLSGKVLMYDALRFQTQMFEFSKSEITILDRLAFDLKYKTNIDFVPEITAKEALELLNNSDFLFLDIRNWDEILKIEIGNCLQIPLNQLESEWHQLDKNQNLIVFCQSGIRSKKAVEMLIKHDFKNVKSVIGGAIAIEKINKETVSVF